MTHPDENPLDERWSSYPGTVLVFAGEPGVFIDLREEIPPATHTSLSAIGLGAPFGIVTAFNPGGVELPAEVNWRRLQELEGELRSSGDEFIRVDACSPDRAHCECSVALKADLKRVIDVAKRWDQIAIFWWDGSAFWIYGAMTEGSLRLPA